MTETYPLSAAAVNAALTTAWLGRPAYFRAETHSTNDELHELALAGAPAGTLLVADYQTQGKGRLNRRWEAPRNTSLLCSLLFRPSWPAERASWLVMIAGLAAAKAIQTVTGLKVALKWPNDLVLGGETGPWRKVGGILLSATFSNGQLAVAILGTGINVNIPGELLPQATMPPTSLLLALGRPVSRPDLLASYLAHLEDHYQAADSGHSPRAQWQDRLITLGRTVTVRGSEPAHSISGVAEATDDWGSLLVRDAAGRLHTITAGDASLRTD